MMAARPETFYVQRRRVAQMLFRLAMAGNSFRLAALLSERYSFPTPPCNQNAPVNPLAQRPGLV
jgi:hypothetical protein